jgi:hypothetical protein
VFCPKIAVILGFTGDILIPRFVAVFCNVNIPFCNLSSESAIMTCSSVKRGVFNFVLVDKIIPFM